MDFRATALPDASRVGVRRSGRPDLAARRASGPAVRVSALLAETRHALVRRLAGSQLAIRLKQQPSVVRPGSWFVAAPTTRPLLPLRPAAARKQGPDRRAARGRAQS